MRVHEVWGPRVWGLIGVEPTLFVSYPKTPSPTP